MTRVIQGLFLLVGVACGKPDSDTAAPDLDGDGYAAGEDCDDDDGEVHPDADEVCDGVDNDCDGETDEDSAVDAATWYADADGDAYGDNDVSSRACSQPSGAVADNSDCDDDASEVHPGAEDSWYDGIDSDCDGADDYDADSDGHRSDEHGGEDCDDSDPAVHPDADDVFYDGVDADCDGADDYDADGDGYASDAYGGEDCDDSSPLAWPGALEICDGIRNDCSDSSWSSDAGLASFEADDGAWADLSSYLGVGAYGAPVAHTLAEAGQLSICEGTWYLDLTVTAELSILGVGQTETVLSGGDAGTIVTVQSSGLGLLVSGLTLQEGNADSNIDRDGRDYLTGGALLCDGASTVQLQDVTVTGNEAEMGAGLAAVNGCELSIDTSTLSLNHATRGAGVYAYGSSTVDLTDLTFSENWGSSGAGVMVDGSSASIKDSLFTENSATGAALNAADSTVTLNRVTITGNSVSSYGGGIYLNASVAYGDELVISENTATWGGGLYLIDEASFTLDDSTIADNQATSTGGGLALDHSSVELRDTVLSGNTSYKGGGVYASVSDLELVDATVTGNTASDSGGGLYVMSNSNASVTTSDFGDNDPEDVYGYYSGSHDYGKGASFDCTEGSCE